MTNSTRILGSSHGDVIVLRSFYFSDQLLARPVFIMAEDPERPQSPSDGFEDLHEAYDHLRASIQELAIEFRFLTAEVARLKQHLQHLAQYAISEKQKRQEATACRDRLLRAFMNRLSAAVNEFTTQLNAEEITPEVDSEA